MPRRNPRLDYYVPPILLQETPKSSKPNELPSREVAAKEVRRRLDFLLDIEAYSEKVSVFLATDELTDILTTIMQEFLSVRSSITSRIYTKRNPPNLTFEFYLAGILAENRIHRPDEGLTSKEILGMTPEWSRDRFDEILKELRRTILRAVKVYPTYHIPPIKEAGGLKLLEHPLKGQPIRK